MTRREEEKEKKRGPARGRDQGRTAATVGRIHNALITGQRLYCFTMAGGGGAGRFWFKLDSFAKVMQTALLFNRYVITLVKAVHNYCEYNIIIICV